MDPEQRRTVVVTVLITLYLVGNIIGLVLFLGQFEH
jgi:hypothetical protein